MRIKHLNCISACPLGGFLMDGFSSHALRGKLTSHCLLLETEQNGLMLVDTGYGLNDVRHPHDRLSAFFLAMNKPELNEAQTAIRQIQALGYDPEDVRHIVLTHLDFDHAGGLDDFPWAKVHLLAKEERAATAQKTMLDRMRYRPQQWGTRSNWRMYLSTEGGERWFGFEAVRTLESVLGSDVLLVPLIGHTLGHAGVAVKQDDGNWLLLAGDAYFFHAEMDAENPYCTPGLRMYQTLMEKDRKARLENQQRLRELKAAYPGAVTLCCSHDVREFEALSGQPLRLVEKGVGNVPRPSHPAPQY
jgi:glyoxylase-like metal-dependent hydrolase (beta-lactamase superfamily II)